MTTTATPYDEQELRREVRAWIEEHWTPDLTVRAWWQTLVDSGWAYPTWPVEWFGKGLDPDAGGIVHDELARAGVLGPPNDMGTTMAAPVIFAFGTEEQKRRWLPALAYGTENWAQFFSEPGAGSDLASVQCKAERDGDEWVLNGQKVWNSGTLLADRGMIVTRTDADLPKHKGIGFFIVDLDQPGVEIRPIKQMNGYAEFNETFFTDARVPADNLLGEVHGGWAVAMNVLTHERSTFAGGGHQDLRSTDTGTKAGHLDRQVGEVLADEREGAMAANALPVGTIEAVIALAREHDRLGDPVIRDRIAGLHAYTEALRLTAERGLAAARAGRDGGAMSSVSYLGGVMTVRLFRDLIADIAGASAMLDGTAVAESITTAPCHGIQGGSEQIQRTVIGERLLGLPKEPSNDRDVPFRQLKVGTQRD